MRDAHLGAGGGLAFVGLSVVGGLMLPKPPSPDASAGTIGRYLVDHQERIQVASCASAVAALGLLALVAFLHGRLGREPFAARLVLAGGAVLVAVGVLGAMVQGVVAQIGDRLHGDSLLLAFGMDRAIFYVAPAFGVVLLMSGVARGATAAGLPSWLGGASVVVALVGILAGVGQLLSTSTVFAALGLVGFILTVLWVAATSTTVWREDALVPLPQSVA